MEGAHVLRAFERRGWPSRRCNVKLVVSEPVCIAPCTAPAAPPSLCISTTEGTVPQMFGFPADDQASADSPMAKKE